MKLTNSFLRFVGTLMIRIEKSFHGPEVVVDTQNGKMHIRGRSIVADPLEFYGPVLQWLESVKNSIGSFTAEFDIDYFNTASHKMILQILILLAEAKKNGGDVTIVWKYAFDDEDMKEIGEESEMLTGLRFIYKEISDN